MLFIILEEIKIAIKNGEFKNWLNRKKVINNNLPKPNANDIKQLAKYSNLEVSERSTSDWYCLLGECQGSLNAVLESGYLLNHCDKNGKPYFEEYAYIYNFDKDTFDFYNGYSSRKSDKIDNFKF